MDPDPSISQRYRSGDPDPHQNVTDPQHWFNSLLLPYVFSAPKLKGRPRKRRKGKEPADPNSPEGSDSNGSENSMAVAGKVRCIE